MRYDVVVVGGGHNGLVCAAYLGRAGLRVLVLERRQIVGGACVTEEIFPGYRFTTASMICSLVRPDIIRTLELRRHGFELIPMTTSFTPFPDGRSLHLGRGPSEDHDQIAAFSRRDAEAHPRFERLMRRLADVLRPTLDITPPGGIPCREDLAGLLRSGRRLLGLSRFERSQLVKVLTASSSAFLSEWFESNQMRGNYAATGSIGVWGGPRTPGTAFPIMHHSLGDMTGTPGVWGSVRGGMGALAESIASAARRYGVEIRTGSPVARILARGGSATGVVLESGEEIPASVVASGADPHQTFVRMMDRSDLPEDFVTAVERIRYTGNVAKVNLALSELPDFTALPGDGPHLRGDIQIVGEGISTLDEGFREFEEGKMSSQPYMEISLPSTVDDSLAPAGRHVASIALRFVPYDLAEGEWNDARREAVGDRVVEVLSRYAPNLPGAVVHRQVLTPKDLEDVYGLTRGSSVHGDLAADQLFFMRPVYGWARYRTPVRGLYLCSSGAHPGGGVMGAPGRNAARQIIRDRRRARLRA